MPWSDPTATHRSSDENSIDRTSAVVTPRTNLYLITGGGGQWSVVVVVVMVVVVVVSGGGKWWWWLWTSTGGL